MTVLAAAKETGPKERRFSLSPDTVKKFKALGVNVRAERGGGEASGISDEALANAGADIVAGAEATLEGAHIILTVGAPSLERIELLARDCLLVGMLAPHQNAQAIESLSARGVLAFALELLPRISRAQGMDVLSSQANLAGYRAVIDAVASLAKATPMMMTAAGTVPPAKVLVLGAGVAGLQAIATAKRLGAVVHAFDVRPAVKEQVESLGAKFIEVPAAPGAEAETKGGYAKEMDEDYKRKQAALIQETLAKMDVAITTALIPGRRAPVLITEDMVRGMKRGSVIVDLAVASGGNCPLSRPDETVVAHGVTILGDTNLPSRVAADATPLYARNLYNFVATFFNKEKAFAIPYDDELVKATLVTSRPQFQEARAR